jgi:chromosome segregation ATPase
MTILNAAFAFVFFCNLMFMVGVAYALMRILDATERSQVSLQNAASQVIEAGSHIKVVVRRAFSEMERTNEILESRESSAGRAVGELSFQVKTLIDRLKPVLAKTVSDKGESKTDAGNDGTALYEANPEELRAKLHAELESALKKNHQLQDEIDQTRYRLNDASHSNKELQEEIKDVKGVKQSVVDNLLQRTQELEEQLEKARERAKAAEKHAEANAFQLDEIRAQISEQKFSDGVDQSDLIQGQQDQIDVLAAREKALMARIDQLEQAFSRNQTEKNFIEDRFLKLDAGESVPPSPSAEPPSAESGEADPAPAQG